jgi:hypothetical protein
LIHACHGVCPKANRRVAAAVQRKRALNADGTKTPRTIVTQVGLSRDEFLAAYDAG